MRDRVSDTGPLIALAKVDQLILLERLFGKVLIPPAVQRELLAKHGAESARLDDALLNFLDVVPLSMPSPEVRSPQCAWTSASSMRLP